ncbi:MAG TPA: hypothetical protein VM096_01440 [Vicinamibacterales bacterium]|nr:hypothetical protein [Vicinamibacterales bacterium]
MAAAFALYFPMLSIGLLSDDFVLVARAHSGVLVDRNWDYLRPLPLGIWSLLIQVSSAAATPVVLHALNIGLHGVNASLTGMFAMRLGLDRRSAFLSGLLFLVFPASVEAVVWSSGIFDVLLVTLILSAAIAITSAAKRNTQTIAVGVLTVAALATKETAAILPALLIVAAYASPYVTLKRAAVPIAASMVLVAVYMAVRIGTGFTATPPSAEFTGYAVKEFFSRPFGGLAVPFHLDVLDAHPWIPFALALYWPALFLVSATRWHHHVRDGRTILTLAAWILVSVAPVATMLFIADDLEGSRYLYIGTVAWSVMVVMLTLRFQTLLRFVATVPLLVQFAFAARAHQSAWIAAAVERDRVLEAYRQSGVQCAPTEIRGLPDQVRGAYVFRNGATEAIASVMPSAIANSRCVLVWDGTRFIAQ